MIQKSRKKHDDIKYSMLQNNEYAVYKLGMIEECNSTSYKGFSDTKRKECTNNGFRQFTPAEVSEAPKLKKMAEDFGIAIRSSFH